MNLDPLATNELYGNLCNIVERVRVKLPRPGEDGDDGLIYTSKPARAAANDILDVAYRAFGQERTTPDPIEWVRKAFPGQTDGWYANHLRAMAAYMERDGDQEGVVG